MLVEALPLSQHLVSLTLSVLGMLAVVLLALMISASERRATQRAEAIVRRHLSPRELAELNRCGCLLVPSRLTSGRVYRIRARGGPVDVLEGGVPRLRLCIRTRDRLPGREEVVAHKLLLETAEEDYLWRANIIWRASDARTRRRTAWRGAA